MGGHVFNHHNPPLPTPRMPPEIYDLVLAQTQAKLKTAYKYVASPIEAPEKTSYGDVDLLVTAPRNPSHDPAHNPKLSDLLAKLLGARAVANKGSPVQSYAIPWPGDDDGQERYVQVDVQHLPNYDRFQWGLFQNGHGDLWSMLGSTIRPFGLTVDNTSMYLRIPEIDPFNRTRAKIYLTSNPAKVLDFLGLDQQKFWTKFESKQALFEYVASSRFFWIKPAKEVEGKDVGEKEDAPLERQDGSVDARSKLKHNDRRRMNTRVVFAEFMDDFIPRCREQGLYATPRITKEQVKLEAFSTFGVQDEYEEKLKTWSLERHRDEMWRVTIKGSVPEVGVDPQFRAAAIKTFKRVLVEGEPVEGVKVPESVACDGEGMWDVEAARRWVEESWEEVGAVGWSIQLVKAREKMGEKEKKKKT